MKNRVLRQLMFLFMVNRGLVLAGPLQGVAPPPAANATIERVEVSGLSEQKLSAELRADMQKLVGQVYDAEIAAQLAEGVQIELPEYVAAVKTTPAPASDRIALVFVVAKISDNEALKSNINARYIVESIEVTGKPAPKLSDGLNADLQRMVGQPLDNALADKLGSRIVIENSGADNLTFFRKLRRGAAPEHVRILYEVRKEANRIGFSASPPAYHSKQGFSGGNRESGFFWIEYEHYLAGKFSVHAMNDGNALIERFAGVDFRYGRRIERFQVELNYSSLRAQWKPETLWAAGQAPGAPELYRLRDTFGGSVGFKLPLWLNARVGASSTELQMQTFAPHFEKSRAMTGSLAGDYTGMSDSTIVQTGSWNYSVKAGARSLGSDFVFARHEWNLGYAYRTGPRPMVAAKFAGGRVTGNAPLAERFSLGNGTNLRGWNKYEIAPLGGNRLAYASLAYTYRLATGFYDVGAVWDAGNPAKARHSIGAQFDGFASQRVCRSVIALVNPLCWAPTVAVPLRSGPIKPMFMIGLHF